MSFKKIRDRYTTESPSIRTDVPSMYVPSFHTSLRAPRSSLRVTFSRPTYKRPDLEAVEALARLEGVLSDSALWIKDDWWSVRDFSIEYTSNASALCEVSLEKDSKIRSTPEQKLVLLQLYLAYKEGWVIHTQSHVKGQGHVITSTL